MPTEAEAIKTMKRLTIESVHELPWFNRVLEDSIARLEEGGPDSWPSWYRENRDKVLAQRQARRMAE